jgi:peptidoglycan/xylan/chitin deacetylase (PgdA/CDA1 family)
LGEIVRRGHEVAGHGYSHRAFNTLSQRELEAELERTAALLPKSDASPRNTDVQLVRPPHGALSARSLMICKRAGFYPVLWSRDSDDCRTSSSETIVSALCDKPLRPGDIVLMHEGQPWTMRALEPILRHLISEGHELTTVGDLLGA